MREHRQVGKTVRVAVVRGLRDIGCSLCMHRVTVGVRASVPTLKPHYVFCGHCAAGIGRAASAIGRRKAKVRA